MGRGAGRRGFVAGAAAALAALKVAAVPFAERAAPAAATAGRRIYRIDLGPGRAKFASTFFRGGGDWNCSLERFLGQARAAFTRHTMTDAAEVEARIQQAVREGWLTVEELP